MTALPQTTTDRTMIIIVMIHTATAMPKVIQHHILALWEASLAPYTSPTASRLPTLVAYTMATMPVGQKQRISVAMAQPR